MWLRKAIGIAALCLTLGGCSTLTHYTSRVGPVRERLSMGDVAGAASLLQQNRLLSSPDSLCYMFEEGILKQAQGDFAGSNSVFSQAAKFIDDRDMRPIVSIGKTGEQVGSVILNEKTMAYEGEGYERVFMHSMEALNYLLQSDKEKSRAEILQAYQACEAVQERNRKKLEQTENDLSSENSKHSGAGKQLDQNAILGSAQNVISKDPDYSAMESRALSVKNAYQNAFTYYLSSLVFEMNGDYDNAYIECKMAHDLRPGFIPAQEDLIRLAGLNAFNDEKENWSKEFNINPNRPDGVGDLVVVFQCGSAPEKKQIWIPIPIPEVGIQSIAFPIYKPVPYPADAVTVLQDGAVIGKTQIVADMDALAVRNLKDRIPEMIIRTAIRFAVKAMATYQMNKQMGVYGTILGSALTAITEQADLRSWLLMPSTVQVARIPMKAGDQDVTISLLDYNGLSLDKRDIKVKIEPNKITVVNLRGIRNIVNDVQIAPAL